ncbi:2-oxo-4-hydroxy-4-carboxy-5-ureidoimidazoline decarboxylase [Paramicrobacterium chengjingii]|uniref:2-oxo-4-hydroxy-4-carboxy-5-ureidoimidazoline decarboxylase n=1 Tax=Paramicrobacterium chengjingii TaxID=2769067 RepID=A0ABX6YF91_9MICO|nr:2-oxo-4-hydroxy-4-carboxy-5-ureidoimidazoline decarboxylase [Microbacterium chengjingii]QPZ37449.1 2-oxo-4-hydroxy-4-carboxy-5-ureidoimidazoline decarboxylase [Microbacterium chengjingii]
MQLEQFNQLPDEEALAAVRPCLDVERWGDAIVTSRPFSSRQELLAFAAEAAWPFTESELERALSHHPRIGERAAGEAHEASLSRSEQAALDISQTTAESLAAGNRAYEEKFDRVFLIRAAGRSSEEILAALNARLGHTAEEEQAIVDHQLREIAALRLEGVVSA